MSNTPTPRAQRAGSADVHQLAIIAPELREVRHIVWLNGTQSGFIEGDSEPGVEHGSVLPQLIAKGWRIAAILPRESLWLMIPPPM